jgi:SPP1 gp7 family putative phage head morphogenesis protein
MKTPRIGPPIYASAGIEASYCKRLECLVDEMNRSILYWLTARWRDNPPQLATDESWDSKLRRTLRALNKRWQDRFDDVSGEWARRFADQVTRHTTARMQDILTEGRVPTVEFRMTATTRQIVNAVTQENVGLIRSIASEHLAAVNGIVMRSVATGRDLGTLAKELEARFEVPKKRAALIARDQNNKASAVITRSRQAEAGITQAVWVHSDAGRVPRPEHVKWNGKPYDVAKGMWSEVDNAFVWPGTPIQCRCFSRPVLPGF